MTDKPIPLSNPDVTEAEIQAVVEVLRTDQLSIGPHLEHIIHSPKSVDRDELVARLTAGTITREELPVLTELLHEAIGKDEWTNEKRFAGVLLLARATALFNEDTYERRRSPR